MEILFVRSITPCTRVQTHRQKKNLLARSTQKNSSQQNIKPIETVLRHIGLGNRDQAPPLTLPDRPSSDASVGTLFSLVARVWLQKIQFCRGKKGVKIG
jgi:hypothetical protein